jgi:tRNA pseudouridine38-40 synthase
MYLPQALNYEAMAEACGILMQYNDFGCFSKSHTQVQTNICTILHASWAQHATHSVFCVEANRFLRNMVRAIVGTLLEIGLNKVPSYALHGIIQSQNRSEAGQSVPACGLYLVDVRYPFEV